MLKLHTTTKHLVKRLALLSGVTAIGALVASGPAMAADVTAPIQRVGSMTEANVSWTIDANNLDHIELDDCASLDSASCRRVLNSASATSARVRVDDNVSHRFRVRAVSAGGVRGAWKYGPRFKRTVFQSSTSTAPLMNVDSFTIPTSPSYSGGATLRERDRYDFYADRIWSNQALNIALIGTRGPDMGTTTVQYDWKDDAGRWFSVTRSVTQRANERSYKQVLHQLGVQPWSMTRGRGIAVAHTPYDGGYSDVDAIVIFEEPLY